MAQKNKITPIVFKGIGDFDGREFTLEFNRKTVMKAEKAGLNLQEIDSKPMTMVGIMFWAAFLYHHPWITQEQTDKILDEQFGGVEGLGTIENAGLPAEFLPDNIYNTFHKGDESLIAVFFDTSSSAEETINAIKEMDEGAFTNVIKTEQVNGRFYMTPKN